MLDSWGKPGAGIKWGNLQWMGNYRECQQIHSNFSFSVIDFGLSDNNTLKFGICLPTSCKESDIKTFLNVTEVWSLLNVENLDIENIKILNYDNQRGFSMDSRTTVAL